MLIAMQLCQSVRSVITRFAEQSAVQLEPLYAYIAEANGDETLDQALGLDSV